MKKSNVKKKIETKLSSYFGRKSCQMLLFFALLWPLVIKVFLDTPGAVADYLCNSYIGVYPLLSDIGFVVVQIVSVLAELLRAGLIGCLLVTLLYALARGTRGKRLISYLLICLVSPLVVSAVGLLLNYACVVVGISRDSMGLFRLKLPQLYLAAMLEYFLYAVLVICAILILYHYLKKKSADMFGGEGFFPANGLFRVLTIAVVLFGSISLLMTLSDTLIDLKTYDVTASFSSILGYLVLPYLYLILKLASMLFFAAATMHKLDRVWKKGEKEGA